MLKTQIVRLCHICLVLLESSIFQSNGASIQFSSSLINIPNDQKKKKKSVMECFFCNSERLCQSSLNRTLSLNHIFIMYYSQLKNHLQKT